MGCIRCMTVCTTGSISYIFHGKYTKKSQRLTVRATTDLFGKCHQYLVLLYTSNPSTGVHRNSHSLLPCPLPLLGSYAVSAELYGVTLKERNLSADHLEQFHTHSFDQHLHRQNHVTSELPAPLGNACVS